MNTFPAHMSPQTVHGELESIAWEIDRDGLEANEYLVSRVLWMARELPAAELLASVLGDQSTSVGPRLRALGKLIVMINSALPEESLGSEMVLAH